MVVRHELRLPINAADPQPQRPIIYHGDAIGTGDNISISATGTVFERQCSGAGDGAIRVLLVQAEKTLVSTDWISRLVR